MNIVGGFNELRIDLGDLLLVAEVAEGIEQIGGAHELGDGRLDDFEAVGRGIIRFRIPSLKEAEIFFSSGS